MEEIIVVTGIPRSGTSLLMQLLDKGGIPVFSDSVRGPDIDNPNGYYELEKVKSLTTDVSWIDEAQGHCIKIITHLLRYVEPTTKLKVIWVQRNIDEVMISQRKMLTRMGKASSEAPESIMRKVLQNEMQRMQNWFSENPQIPHIIIQYQELIQNPLDQAKHIAHFLGGDLQLDAMANVVDNTLYRSGK